MAYSESLADRVRVYLVQYNHDIEEKKMFGGLAFMVNGKMCVNISKDRLMCRFNPIDEEELCQKVGYEQMIMKGRKYKGYCYIHPEGYSKDEDFTFWIEQCLAYNAIAKSSKK